MALFHSDKWKDAITSAIHALRKYGTVFSRVALLPREFRCLDAPTVERIVLVLCVAVANNVAFSDRKEDVGAPACFPNVHHRAVQQYPKQANGKQLRFPSRKKCKRDGDRPSHSAENEMRPGVAFCHTVFESVRQVATVELGTHVNTLAYSRENGVYSDFETVSQVAFEGRQDIRSRSVHSARKVSKTISLNFAESAAMQTSTLPGGTGCPE